MKRKIVYFNGRFLTQADGLMINSMAVAHDEIVAVGNNLHRDRDWRGYSKIDLHGYTVVPGLVDAHTHFYLFVKSLAEVSLSGIDSLDKCLVKIETFAQSLPRRQWLIGAGLFVEGFARRIEPDRYMLDKVSGGRPAFIFYKDTHTAWVNTRALEVARIDARTPDPPGGRIERLPDGSPSGILREAPAYLRLFRSVPPPSRRLIDRFHKKALEVAYRKGVTGVHSFDSPDGFAYLSDLAAKNKIGLRINYYPPAAMMEHLERTNTRYGTGTPFFRIAGVKIFADGSLGSQTALCFHKYRGSEDNYGIEVTSPPEIARLIRRASGLGMPCAIHAIGDRAIANVLDAVEFSGRPGGRHRIEHLQLVRRKDLARVKRLGIVASMQPSHCPADIAMVRRYWPDQSANAYVFRTVLDKGIPLAFGSDAPIEPLDPIAGIAAAVRRANPGSRDIFHPEQRIYATEGLQAYTVGSAYACGQEDCRGRLLPGYPADFVVLDRDITRIAPARIYDTTVLATVLDGIVRYQDPSLKW
ncbi:MAG: amidohydrolase [Candidatus Zixiibacteriota bacterium]